MTRTLKASCLALFTGVALLSLSVPAALAGPHVSFQVGIGVPVAVAPAVVAPVIIPPAPAYGTVWQPGYYAWSGYAYTWVPGAWVRPPFAGALWVAPHLERGRWSRGYWRR